MEPINHQNKKISVFSQFLMINLLTLFSICYFLHITQLALLYK